MLYKLWNTTLLERNKPVYHLARGISGAVRALASPLLRKQTEDGQEVEVSENELRKYTRYQWLRGNSERLAERYCKFNLQALVSVAISTASSGAKSCTKILKCVEGQHNKVFRLTMDNGSELVAKLPNPNAGPVFFTTASEVATRHFLREFLEIPIPKIYTWSADSSNTVGSEYIIEEVAAGQSLGSVWSQLTVESRFKIVQQIVDMQSKLMSISFLKHGSIYYKADLDSKCQPSEPLSIDVSGTSMKLDFRTLHKFAIGPLTKASLWTGERTLIDLDRGPWSTPLEYLMAMGNNELRWAESFAKPYMNYHRSLDEPEDLSRYISLLRQYLALAPYFLPESTRTNQVKTLSHPDLHLDNIFVDPYTKSITHIIDWQSAAITDVFLQHKFPPMLGPVSPAVAKGLETKIEETATNNVPSQNATSRYYEQLVKEHTPRRSAILNEDYLSIRTKPVSLITGSWEREDVFSFCHSLIRIAADWERLTKANGTPCPFHLSAEEYARHEGEMELIEGLSEILHQLQDQNLIPLGGMVKGEYFEGVQKANERCKKWFIGLGENERQRELHAKVWPY